MIVEWGREIKSSHVVYYVIYIAYNNNVLCGCVSERFAWIWAYDSSEKPSYYKNDYVMLMGENRFARAARPQPSKMCFLLYKVVLRLRIVDNLGMSEGYN